MIVRAARLVLPVLARAPRLVRGLRVAHVGIVRHVGGRRIHRLARAVGQFLGGDFHLLHAHALRVVGLLAVAVLALVLLLVVLAGIVLIVVFRVARALVAHFERVEQVMDHVAEAALVLDQLLQPVELAAGALLDERPPQVDQFARGRRRRLSGQPLAHHQGDRVLDRRIGAVGDVVELAAMKLVVEHRAEILRHAVHAPRADRLDARLLHRLEHRAALLAGRHLPPVHRRIVAGELERDRIRVPAHDRGVLQRELARRLGQTRLAARDAGPLRRIGDFEIGLARERPHAARDRALERLGRGFFCGRLGFDVGGHRCRKISSAPRSPSSPAARRRSSADRTRRPSAAPAHRTC